MAKRWLNLFFRFSSLVFKLKQKTVEAKNWYVALVYAIFLAVTEILFALISLPLYFIVSPAKLYEQGFVFPSSEGPEKKLSTYVMKRKISLVTLGAAAGIYLLKVLVVGAISLYLLGAPMLFAAVQNWSFDVAGDYTYDSAKIEVTGGAAQLKDLGGSSSGSTTNSGFNSDASGWTYADWLEPSQSTASGGYVASGGNPGGYSQVRLQTNNNKNKTVAGYWYQGFTTTVASPDTATLNLDWASLTFTAPQTLVSYKVYAFIDTTSAAPTLGQEVWSSSEITSTTSWASISPVSITAKVPTAGTYYLKFAARVQTNVINNATNDLITGFDNVIVNWSKISHSYDSTSPTIYPNTSLTSQKILSWNSFTETATKNGGEIYYQLSSDDGATWQYWNGSAWATAGASNYNTATDVNTNIGTFTKATNKIRWKSFLTSNGTQQVILDNVAIDYTENILPSISGLTPSQGVSTGKVYVNYNLVDTESDPSSLTAYEYSLNGTNWFAMTPAAADPLHNGVTGLTSSPAGVAHVFVWDAQTDVGNIYSSTAQVRLTPNDGVANGTTATSTAFTIDYVLPVVTNVTASQTLGGTAVTISYDVSDNTTTDLLVDLEISGDGGSTWTVPTTTATGAVGTGVMAGVGKTITWQAATDYPGYEQGNIQVHVRAKDKFQNQGTYLASSNFSLDTLAPATNVPANLLAQPNAGDTAVLIGGSFAESNPNTNDFYVEVSDGGYGTSTAGTSDTASPSNQSTATATTLNGSSYISKVKITHTDDYGQIFSNENTSPSTTYKYVKPYTPDAPTLSAPITNNLNLTVNIGSDVGGLEYLISETTQSKYVQADGTLGTGEVWRTIGGSTINVNGLSSPVSQYIFKVKSRNPNDSGHAASSESAFSATSQIANTAPSISFGSVAQTTDGSDYVNVNYTATDGQGDISSIPTFQYSTNGSDWTTMTEKSGVGSNGTTNLVFLPTGSNYLFAWDANANLPAFESNTVSVRLKPNDSLVDGDTATSSEFAVDTKVPVISSVSASQGLGGKTVSIGYNLTDGNNSTVTLEISSNGGSSWTVPITSATGDIGVVSPGNGKTITWNAGVDFNDQYNTTMLVRLRATDTKGNIGAYAPSSTFTVDTHSPIVSNVTAAQDSGAKTFIFHYDVSEDLGNVDVVLAISSDGGSTWTVPITSASGATGSGIAPGMGKTITWNGSTDFNDQERTNMQIRITATDQYTNVGNNTSSNFSLDTQAPRITSVSGVETLGTTTVVLTYNLADQNNSNVQFDISSDGGLTWTVPKTAATGDFGPGMTPGNGKTISWDAKTNFPNNDLATMQARVRSTDIFTNAADNVPSANFSLDTIDPATNVAADLQAQPNAGDTTVLIGGSFTETNPNTNDFYTAVSSGDYGSITAGTANTASPANQATGTGSTLNGSNYIPKVKIVHTDDYGQTITNENTSPNTTYKYVKPYTPLAPTLADPITTNLNLTVNPNASETDGLQYAIFETTQSKYVQANGTLGASEVWQTLGTDSGQWGNTSGVSGKVNVNGLSSPLAQYIFKVKSRNSSDSGHAPSSESAFSATAQIANTAPSISFGSISQSIDGTNYVTINYTGTDGQGDISSLATFQYSTNGTDWLTLTEKAGVGSSGTTNLVFLPTGSNYIFVWDAPTDLPNFESNTVSIRLKPNDSLTDGSMTTLSNVTVDTKVPGVSNVAASQVLGTTTVQITYDLSDISTTDLLVELQISSDGGSTWTVPTTSATGEIGSGLTTGVGKTITWDAAVNYPGHQQSNLQVHVKAKDKFQNQGSYVPSSNFSIDTLPPATNVAADLQAQANAGDTAVLIGGSFTEVNPNTNDFYVAISGGAYGAGTAGTTNTASPSNQSTAAGVTLNGSDYISKVKITHTDDYGQAYSNENISPNAAYKYVKPYTPLAPVADNPTVGTVDVTINKNASEVDGLEYAIFETTQSKYVQADGSLGASAVWQAMGTGSGQWGNNTGISGKVTVSGLTNPSYQYQFKVKSINISDASYSASSESDLSSGASSTNQSPTIQYHSVSQPLGAEYVDINYRGIDLESETSSLVYYKYSTDNMTYNTMTEKTGVGSEGVAALAFSAGTGTTHHFMWDITTDLPGAEDSTVYVRLQANDGTTSGGEATSSAFTVDTKSPVISAVTASETLGSSLVNISYTLTDVSSSNVELQISSDGGFSWTVSTASATGEIGAGVTPGSGKTITWNAGADFANQQVSNMQVQIKATDSYQNAGTFTPSSNFAVDTLPPATNVAADLQAQANAGDTAVLIGGSFTEVNPNTNDFYVAVSGGAYGTGVAGTTNTASPSNQSTAAEVTLNGSDYISKVKITHTDDYGQAYSNENISPNAAYKYVKPYTPLAPVADNPTVGTVDVTINKNASEVDGLEYAIFETTQSKYVQANGTLGASAVWQAMGTGSGQWGNNTGVAGKVTVSGLSNPSYQYQFKVKSINISDSSYSASSESDLSSGASSTNQSPTLAFNSLTQTTDGTKYADISYRGIDLESETSSLVYYKYSTDNVTYNTMTEKTGVGSEGVAALAFSAGAGTTHHFMWDVGTDLANTEDTTVYVRLQANDGTTSGGEATSSAFTVDTKGPALSAVTASQTPGSNSIEISYTLADLSVSNNVELQISSDGGSSWTVDTSGATGAVGPGVAPGAGKTISFAFPGQEFSNMEVQIRATDSSGNTGSFEPSSEFEVDTKAPVVTNVSASQSAGSGNVNIIYDLADANNSTVYFDVSNDNGSTWTVVTGTVNNVIPGNGKTIGWVAATDFPNQENTTMKVQVRATDSYTNAGINSPSSTFTVDTRPPTISTVTASQIPGSQNFTISYNLSDNGAVNIAAEISSDDGDTWTVPTSTLTGAVGAGQTTGNGKTINWNAGTDFSGQENNTMKVRVTGTDGFNNSSAISSSIFNLDTLAPTTSVAADLQSQPNAGDTAVLIGGSFTETNPNTNDFYVAINAGAYGVATAGTGNTATPPNQSTSTGAMLTGSDYVSKVKIVETDDYGLSITNENTSPANKYVKPYTPPSPTINNPQNSSVDVTINPHASESATVEYSIYEVGSGKYVQTNGTLNTTEVWKTLGTGAGQWGLSSGVSGKITVIGLVSPVAQYSFRIKSRNPSDAAHLPSSESNLSNVSAISNTAPTISITSAAQQGSNNYALINYTGTDTQNDTTNLVTYEYSTDNVVWNTMTERSGVGSDGTSGLIFTTAGSPYVFAWDIATDLPNAENATVYIKLAPNDGLVTGSVATSSAFPTDTRGPVISNLSTSQTIGSNNFNIRYDVADISGSNINVVLQISSDGGSTWTVPTTTATGDVGASVTSGVNKSIAWNAGVDFPNHEQSNMQLRLRATDAYNNAGDYATTSNFTIDTKVPVVSAVTASQTAGSGNVVINYTITDTTPGGNFVELEISDDNGLTWTVTPTIISGDIGAGVNTGALSITWNAATDFVSQYQSDIKVRVKARDYFGNQGDFTPSSAFTIDTVAPVVSAVSAAQTLGTGTVVITYTLADDSPSNMTVDLDVSPDGGLTWNTTVTTLTGDVGANQTAGNKTVSWDAATDFGNEDISNVRVRVNATDGFANINTPVSSGDFAVDTKTPQNLISLSKFSSTSDTVTLNWSTPIVETNFNHYEIWHGSSQDDVNGRTGTATVWNVANDATLSNLLTSSTVITGISITGNYYAKVWAVDNYGNEATAVSINLFTPPVTPEVIAQAVISSGGGGGALPVQTLRQMVLPKPVLTSLPNTINQTRLLISGLSSPGTRIDIYDNGVLIGRIADPADANGRFNQLFVFAEGSHRLTARAINTRNNSSEFSDPIQFTVLLIAPNAPTIISPENNVNITSDTLLLTGTADPFSTVQIVLDDGTIFTSQTDANGEWLFNLPSPLELGPHNFTVREVDLAENVSPETTLLVNKLETLLEPASELLPTEILPVSILVMPPGTGTAPTIVPNEPAPIELIETVESAITLPGLVPPKIVSAQVPMTTGANIMSFGGIAEPNQNVVVYIHSDQAVIYNTKADSKGLWTVNHSQNTIELTPGIHTIYSVGLDQNARVKSLPSAISQFTVTKNLWAVLYSYLNLYTTSFAIAVILLAMFWLYRIRNRL